MQKLIQLTAAAKLENDDLFVSFGKEDENVNVNVDLDSADSVDRDAGIIVHGPDQIWVPSLVAKSHYVFLIA